MAFAVSTAVVFVAELGDKSQLMALTFATRYRALPVILGITIATAVVHLVSVVVGHGLGAALPTGWIALVAAVAFVGFGAWTLRGDELSDEESRKAARSKGNGLVAVTVAFFLAELGDKTMLATITLATQHGWAGVWLGSTIGMVAADALAIVVGRALGKRLPEQAIRYGAAALFLVFGVWLAYDALTELSGRPAWDVVADALDHHAAGWVALGLLVVSVLLGWLGRSRVRRSTAERLRSARTAANWWARGLFATATLLGLVAPLLVAFDVIDPIALFDAPAVVVVGAALSLLGTALLLASQVEVAALHRTATQGGRPGPVLATAGLHKRVRHPALTGIVIALAGTLVMVPTVMGVLAAVLMVAAVQVQVRAVRDPHLARLHGETYAEYAARTGRFLPRLRPGQERPRVADRAGIH